MSRTRMGEPSLLARRLRIEGPSGTYARARAHLAERRRANRFRPAPAGWAPRDPVPVLHVFPTFPTTPFGGVEVQLRARLDTDDHPWALLRRVGPETWRLEVSAAGERVSIEYRARPADALTLESPELEDLVREAARRVGARILHFETALGFPLSSLRSLARRDAPLVLSVHDFALFCPRPHLYSPELRSFCEYSTDAATCHRCLLRSWPDVAAEAQANRRSVVPALFESCARVVFPSEFLRRQHEVLFGTGTLRRALVVPPLSSDTEAPARGGGRVRRVAFLGGGHVHKGVECFAEVVAHTRRLDLRFVVYGGDPPDGLESLRRLPAVRIRGTYLPGTLAQLLRRDAIDLALLLPAVPESYCLALDECVLAGVPVIALARGALCDRVGELEAGWLVPPEEGTAGVVARLEALCKEQRVAAVPEASRQRLVERRRHTLETWSRLYGEL
ncbi:MAG TPA: glycosyltransferase [Thermoanaerobaculia bacterium]|nr:glycosyltransferase [Thermoanaerobaculia bacterium]